MHPYTSAGTAGFNLIVSVVALRSTFPTRVEPVVAFGGSQGGRGRGRRRAGRYYAPDLEICWGRWRWPRPRTSPGRGDKGRRHLTTDQGPAYILIIESLARLHP